MNSLVLPTLYFAPVSVYSLILRSEKLIFDGHENFVKQTFRSRCEIYGANGRQMLSVPVERRGHNIPSQELKISYKEDWQKKHWRSVVSAYRNSPYFQYYADEFEHFFKAKPELLFDFNLSLHKSVMKLLKVEIEVAFSEKYIAEYGKETLDLRAENILFTPTHNYNQVFEERHGFIPNLSILDLLFNAGPDSVKILSSI